MAIGTRLRALSSRLTEEAVRVYSLYGVDVDPRWFPVLFMLGQRDGQPVTDLARAIGQSHAAVSQVVKAMTAVELVDAVPSPMDGRVRELRLTAKGRRHLERLQEQCDDVTAAIEKLLAGTTHNLWQALSEAEAAFESKGLYRRVVDQRRERLAPNIQVREFVDADAPEFARLNLAWIEQYFRVEAKDRASLEDPWSTILQPGGKILVAVSGQKVFGTVAMIPIDDDTVELAKMAVADNAQGLGIGQKLGEAFFEHAKRRGAKRVFLESNTVLKPAMKLYEKLGFLEIEGPDSPYDRCNIQMERWLTDEGSPHGPI